MFEDACVEAREAVYGILSFSQIGGQNHYTMGTGFAIASGVIITTAHALHRDGNVNNPPHTRIEVIRTPDIGQNMEIAHPIAEDLVRDVGLLRIANPRSSDVLTLHSARVPNGTPCGSLGFPLSKMEQIPQSNRSQYVIRERFQGAYISAYLNEIIDGHDLNFYEIDRVMYHGSSGCPVFLQNTDVVGMQVRTRTDENKNESTSLMSISLLIPSTNLISFAREQSVL